MNKYACSYIGLGDDPNRKAHSEGPGDDRICPMSVSFSGGALWDSA